MNNKELHEIKIKIRDFCDERNWDQFHTPKNIAQALAGEVGELNQIFRWLDTDYLINNNKDLHDKVCDEVADIFIFLILFTEKTKIDLLDAVSKKIQKNKEKYPIDMAGKS